MKYNLFGYVISGETVGIEKLLWDDIELNGNEPFVLASGTTLSGYTNITSIENMYNFGFNAINDFQTWQKGVRLCGYEKGWSAMTVTEKDLIIDSYGYPEGSTEIITYLINEKGMTQSEADKFLLDSWYEYWNNFLEDCPHRWHEAAKLTLSYLEFWEVSKLLDNINVLIDKYIFAGRLGVGYGDTSSGLMNFIYSSSIYLDGWLEEFCNNNGYVLKMGNYSDFKLDLENILLDSYFWPEIKNYI